ncbi:MAG: 50S ribosomal protein L4 [Burkholderiales bacterium]|jgi:large subunit ribosomal protein L4|nr:50S ribosomal protein L4 [Burkholderiales bacterium]
MELQLKNDQGQISGNFAVSDALFAREQNEALVHQIVVAYQANGRQGTRAQKARGEVNKSNRKPWAQKGTGRARAGRASSPLWRGGGKIFPSSPEENFSQKVNRKMYRAGMAAILSQLVRDDRLTVLDTLVVETPKTKAFAQKVNKLGLDGRLLVVIEDWNDNIMLASRNLPNVMVLSSREVDPVSLLRFDHTVMTKAAVQYLEEMLG